MAENEKEVTSRPSLDDKYGGLSQDLIDLLKNYEITYFREDKPIPFCGLSIYPISVRNYEEFASCCSCLTLDKNEDVKGIAMSHLDYLLKKMNNSEDNKEAKIWSYKLQRLFELIFHIENGIKCKKCGKIIKFTDKAYTDFLQRMSNLFKKIQEHPDELTPEELSENYSKFCCPDCGCHDTVGMISIVEDEKTKKKAFSVDGHIINKNDFGKLRQIVLFQNYPDYADESNVDPEIKKDHDEKMRIQQMKNDVHASIEKKVVCLSISTHYKIDEIYDMSIRRFTMALATVDDLINYKIMKQAISSGFVSLPKGKNIEHWIYKPIKDIYGDAYKSMDEVNSEVSKL